MYPILCARHAPAIALLALATPPVFAADAGAAPVALSSAAAAPVGPAAELRSLRLEVQRMRESYEIRLQALEQRLRAAEGHLAMPATTASGAAAPPATGDPSSTVETVSAPPPSAPSGANAFNPAISLILSGGYARLSRDPTDYVLPGIPLPTGTAAGPGRRGFNLGESELGLSASIDPWWRGAASISLHADDSVSVEEAFVQTTALGHGLTLKAGRFFSAIGYLNGQHAHVWDFPDSPLAYRALLGGQLARDGVRLEALAPTDQYLSVGIELGGGDAFSSAAGGRNGAGIVALTAHAGGDIGESHNWLAGVSLLDSRSSDQSLTGVDAGRSAVAASFDGSTRIWVADAVWKWAPDGNASRVNFKLQGEYLRAQRSGSLTQQVNGISSGGAYRATPSGGYLQAVYQFMPRWRVGLRTEWLAAGSPDYGASAGLWAADAGQARKHTLMVDHSASEFSRWRLQLAQDLSRPGRADQQLQLNYQMSLGAHGAHGY